MLPQAVAGHDGIEAELVTIHHPFEAAEIPSDSPFIETVGRAVSEVTGEPPEIFGTPYGSDVRNLVNDAKMEAITFGAGDISLCHCPDERQSLEQLRKAATVMTMVAIDVLGAA